MEDTRDNEEDMRVHFKVGDKIRVKPFFSNHLLESYPASKWLTEERTVEALDEGASEGLDVYDVRLDDGSEESVYGVQVIANLSK